MLINVFCLIYLKPLSAGDADKDLAFGFKSMPEQIVSYVLNTFYMYCETKSPHVAIPDNYNDCILRICSHTVIIHQLNLSTQLNVWECVLHTFYSFICIIHLVSKNASKIWRPSNLDCIYTWYNTYTVCNYYLSFSLSLSKKKKIYYSTHYGNVHN